MIHHSCFQVFDGVGLSAVSCTSAAILESYHPLSSFLAARLAFMAAFLALPPFPAFSCCLVSFGSAREKRGVSCQCLRRSTKTSGGGRGGQKGRQRLSV